MQYVLAATSLTTAAAHLSSRPADRVITDTKGSDLASILLSASLHTRGVHTTDIRIVDDLLPSLSKAK